MQIPFAAGSNPIASIRAMFNSCIRYRYIGMLLQPLIGNYNGQFKKNNGEMTVTRILSLDHGTYVCLI